MNFKILFALLLVGGFCFSFTLVADVDKCMEITSPGTYNLITDLSGSISTAGGQACIYIQSNEVTLDCKIHDIVNNDPNTGAYAIFVDTSKSVSVKNCNVVGYSKSPYAGLYIYQSEDVTSSSNTFEGNANGISVLSSKNIRLNQNKVINNNVDGIVLDTVTDSSIVENTASSNKAYGFNLKNVNLRNTLTRNTANSNDVGFVVASSSDSNSLTDNKAYNNKAQGFGVIESSSNQLKNNVAHDNAWGAAFVRSNDNTLSGNTFYNNNYGNHVRGSKVTITSDRYYSNSEYDLAVEGDGGTSSTISASKITFDNGNSNNAVKLSITDTSSTSYGIKWADNPSTPVDYVFYPHNSIKVSSPNKDIFSIDSISWDWSDFDTSGYSEDRFTLMKYETSWKSAGGSLSTSSHKISLSALSVAATYTVFQQNPPKKSLQLYYLLGCDKTTITVKDDKGNPVSGATVNFDTIDKLSTFSTNDSGQVVVPSCGKAFTASATKTDYNYVSLRPDQYQCSCMKCTQSSDCSLYQKCEGSQCVGISCPNGVVVNHQCVECAADIDCKNGLVCSQNKCVAKQLRCTSDSNCATDESCQNNLCIKKSVPSTSDTYDISIPAMTKLGDTISVVLKKNNALCAGCSLEFTDPSQNKVKALADGNGAYSIYLEKAGFYQVSVLKNDLPAATATFNVESKENPNQGNTSNQPTNPSSNQTGSVFGDLFSNPLVIGGIIIVIAIAIIGLFTMKK